MGTISMALCTRAFVKCSSISSNFMKLRPFIGNVQWSRNLYSSKQLQDRFFTEQHEWIDVNAASELFCPVSGVVTEKNENVEETPALINQSPYEKGWLFRIQLTKPEELKDLFDEAGYQNYLKSNE